MPEHLVEFPDSEFPPVRLKEGSALSMELNAVNSPLLFGCRSGICGTCLVEVEPIGEACLESAEEDEREALEVYAPGNPKARLACQLSLTAEIRIRKIESA